MGLNYYNDRVCLNVLAGSLENAAEIYEAAEKHVGSRCAFRGLPGCAKRGRRYEEIHGCSGGKSLL